MFFQHYDGMYLCIQDRVQNKSERLLVKRNITEKVPGREAAHIGIQCNLGLTLVWQVSQYLASCCLTLYSLLYCNLPPPLSSPPHSLQSAAAKYTEGTMEAYWTQTQKVQVLN